MSKELTDPKDKQWGYWHVRATVKTVKVRIVSWICPYCKTQNETKLWPGKHRCEYRGVEVRCGKCHGTKRRAVTADNWTVDR